MTDKGVQAINRVLDIVELLATAKEGLGVTEIGQAIGLHKSTVHRLCNALAVRGYIEKDPGGIYRLGLKFMEINGLFLKKLELKTEALPFIRKLAEILGQPVHLAILDGVEVVYIEKVDVVNSIRMYSQIGRRVPAHCTAIGKVLIAALDEERLAERLELIKFERRTPNTITSKEKFSKVIFETRERGWAVDDEENEPGVRCVAAPIYDYTGKVIAAVSVSGDSRVISPDRDGEISEQVRQTAASISGGMGFIG